VPTLDAKVYVPVEVSFDETGRITPQAFRWEDGNRYEIDRVIGVQPAHASKSGGQGDRYTVMIQNQRRFLFFEHNTRYGETILGRWFMERK
jgi:hypothetical protein